MIDPQALTNFCRAHEAWLHETIDALVSIESPTDDKAAADRCGTELAKRLADLGGRVRRIVASTAGDHVIAEFGAGLHHGFHVEPAPPQILLLGHFDTVWPVGQLQRMPLHRNGELLYGPGVLDMKAGIAMAMLATRALMTLAPPSSTRVVMLWTSDEETGSRTSRALVETEAPRSAAVLVLEPALPEGVLKTRRKGCGEYEIVIHGEAAHAGVDPGKGVSAIRELARQVLAVETLHDIERGVTVNVGVISGGSRGNVVPAEARAVIDVRAPSMADAARVDEAMRGLTPHLPGARIEVHGGFSRPPMERTPAVARLFALAEKAAADVGQSVGEGATGGGSDGNFCAALGVPTLDGLGAIGDGAHALHEHVQIPALLTRSALLAALLSRLALSSD